MFINYCGHQGRMKWTVVLLCIVGVAVAVRDVDWETFKSSYGRKYEDPAEEALRMKTFLDNKMLIDQHNQLFAEGRSTFTMGVNQFADMTIEEFIEKKDEGFGISFSHLPIIVVKSTLPTADVNIDWRTSGCVPPVPNSELCGMSTIFLTETVEFCQCKKYGIKINLSDQCLTDCCQSYGVPSVNYYKCLTAQGGVSTEAAYPTTTCTPSMCEYKAADSGARVGGWVDIITGWESNLQRGLNSSVVHTAVDTTHSSFQLYSGGIYNEPLCSNNTNHNVMVVGYGADVSGVEYWLVKNSWGTSWGEAGYIRMSRNKDNQCGIATYAGYPIC